jgi:hypothetical protein
MPRSTRPYAKRNTTGEMKLWIVRWSRDISYGVDDAAYIVEAETKEDAVALAFAASDTYLSRAAWMKGVEEVERLRLYGHPRVVAQTGSFYAE